MATRLTNIYRKRIADALMGVGIGSGLAPARARLGNGANGGAPGEAMYQAQLDVTLSTARSTTHEIVARVIVPASQSTAEYDELGIFAGDGALLLHCTFEKQPLANGTEAVFEFTFNPEVYHD